MRTRNLITRAMITKVFEGEEGEKKEEKLKNDEEM